jgi:hypothetical protein
VSSTASALPGALPAVVVVDVPLARVVVVVVALDVEVDVLTTESRSLASFMVFESSEHAPNTRDAASATKPARASWFRCVRGPRSG